MTQTLTHKIGFWSSLLFAILGLILIAANIGIGCTGQWQAWEGMESCAARYASVRINFFTIAFVASFLMTILFPGIMAALDLLSWSQIMNPSLKKPSYICSPRISLRASLARC